MTLPLAPPDSTAALAHDLPLACSRFARLAARRADVGVSSVTWRVTAALGRRGELRISDIAALEQVSRPTATTVVHRLEEEGLVVRRADPSDSRSSLVRLTDAGHERLHHWRGRLGDEVEDMLADVPETDREALARAVGIIATLLDEADTTLDPGPEPRTTR